MILDNFVVFEGIDGAGTTTQLKILEKLFAGKAVDFSAEPTGSETGLFLRQVLSGKIKVHPATAAYLFAADRNEHLYGTNGIEKKCSNGTVCFSDRYFFSSLAYQQVTCGLELPTLLNSPFPLPKVLFYFDIDPEVSLKRVDSRGEREIYEKADFLKATRQRYQNVVDSYAEASLADKAAGKDYMLVRTIDASKTVENVTEEIAGVLKEVFPALFS
ncbi:MAG: dTMP kinase [Treponemataceae bacterium]|nr:dTMP kinase [Treponemataceae bacterium]